MSLLPVSGLCISKLCLPRRGREPVAECLVERGWVLSTVHTTTLGRGLEKHSRMFTATWKEQPMTPLKREWMVWWVSGTYSTWESYNVVTWLYFCKRPGLTVVFAAPGKLSATHGYTFAHREICTWTNRKVNRNLSQAGRTVRPGVRAKRTSAEFLESHHKILGRHVSTKPVGRSMLKFLRSMHDNSIFQE